MNYELIYIPEAIEDMKNLGGSQRKLVRKALEKLKGNPLPQTEGGYGQWLGNKQGKRKKFMSLRRKELMDILENSKKHKDDNLHSLRFLFLRIYLFVFLFCKFP